MRAVDPDLDERESFLLAAALREAAEGLPEGRRALLVGQPRNAAAVPGPADQVILPMGKGRRGSADQAGRAPPVCPRPAQRIGRAGSALRYFALDSTGHASHQEQASMIRRDSIWRNNHACDERLRRIIDPGNVA